MFRLYQIVKRSIAETDLLQCEQEQELRCVQGRRKQFVNGAATADRPKYSWRGAL